MPLTCPLKSSSTFSTAQMLHFHACLPAGLSTHTYTQSFSEWVPKHPFLICYEVSHEGFINNEEKP